MWHQCSLYEQEMLAGVRRFTKTDIGLKYADVGINVHILLLQLAPKCKMGLPQMKGQTILHF